MTALIDPIVFNTSTGSDTAASGSAASGVSLSGTGAIFNSTTTVSGIVTTSVAPGDLFWGDTSSGRQYSVVASVTDGTTIVCDDAFAVTESSRNWGIGGKRNDLNAANNRVLMTADYLSGWIIELETDQTISTELTLSVASVGSNTLGGYHFRSNVVGTTRNILQTSNAANFNATAKVQLRLDDIQLTNSNGGTSSIGLKGSSNFGTALNRCVLGDPNNVNNLYRGVSRIGGNQATLLNESTIINCVNVGAYVFNSFTMINSEVIGCGSHGVQGLNTTSPLYMTFTNCVFADNGGSGLYSEGAYNPNLLILNCTIDGNTSDGINTTGMDRGETSVAIIIQNNQITSNGGYGINGRADSNVWLNADYNNYGEVGGATENTLGNYQYVDAGANDMAVDPGYTNAATYDYSIGTATKAGGNPTIGELSHSTSFVDIGAVQREESSGGGNTIVIDQQRRY